MARKLLMNCRYFRSQTVDFKPKKGYSRLSSPLRLIRVPPLVPRGEGKGDGFLINDQKLFTDFIQGLRLKNGEVKMTLNYSKISIRINSFMKIDKFTVM